MAPAVSHAVTAQVDDLLRSAPSCQIRFQGPACPPVSPGWLLSPRIASSVRARGAVDIGGRRAWGKAVVRTAGSDERSSATQAISGAADRVVVGGSLVRSGRVLLEGQPKPRRPLKS